MYTFRARATDAVGHVSPDATAEIIVEAAAALDAARTGRTTVLLDATPIEQRDFTGGRAVQLWEELPRHARRVNSYEEAVAAVLSLG